MLNYFPRFFSDELIYSMISRCHEVSGNKSHCRTSEELFGNRRFVSNVDFGGNLKLLNRKLPKASIFDTEKLIKNHTYLVIYRNFITRERYSKAYDFLYNGKIKELNSMIGESGVGGKIFTNQMLNYCPVCCDEDFHEFGETYFRIHHQIPGFFVCVKHNVVLRSFETEMRKREYISIQREFRKKNLLSEVVHNNSSDLLSISKSLLELMNIDNSQESFGLIRTKQVIRARLEEKSYISVKGVINQKKLHRDIRNYYTDIFLLKLNCDSEFKAFTWIKYITSKKLTSIKPIRAIVLILFLFDDVQHFLNYKVAVNKPFGSGKWPCKNPVCNKSNVKLLSIVRNSNNGLPIGKFECQCGYTYKTTRKHDDIIKNFDRVVTVKRGEVWKKELIRLLNNSDSLNQISRILNCSKKTVKIEAIKSGCKNNLLIRGIKLENITSEELEEILLEQKRDIFLKAIRNGIDSMQYRNRNEIRSNNRKEYDWLYKKYRNELENILPVRCEKKKSYNKNTKVNSYWLKKDKELCEKFHEIGPTPEKVATLSYYAKQLRYEGIYQNYDKLTKLRSLIELKVSEGNDI